MRLQNSFSVPLETQTIGVLCAVVSFVYQEKKPNTEIIYSAEFPSHTLEQRYVTKYLLCKVFTSNSYNIYIKYNQ